MNRDCIRAGMIIAVLLAPSSTPMLWGEVKAPGLEALVQPSTVFRKDGQVVTFAVHGFIGFRTLSELFTYIDGQAARWEFSTDREREAYAAGLFLRGLQSRIVSMQYERPLEILTTHTAQELSAAVARVRTPDAPLIFRGKRWQLSIEAYEAGFLRLQEHWKSSLNCWSATSSIPGRVLSNWYIIDEGITLLGARYDSTEHFWQAVKYHPQTRLNDLLKLLTLLDSPVWMQWLDGLANNQKLYLQHTYALEFLRNSLKQPSRERFRQELSRLAARGNQSARTLQQRDETAPGSVRFTAQEEKTLWGDLADVFHLLYFFTGTAGDLVPAGALKSLRDGLEECHFDAVYVEGYGTGRIGFISREFQQLMLEIWKVKYLQMKRFGDVIRSTKGVHLEHFLNDGDSPDILIPVYVGFLNQIREMALQQKP